MHYQRIGEKSEKNDQFATYMQDQYVATLTSQNYSYKMFTEINYKEIGFLEWHVMCDAGSVFDNTLKSKKPDKLWPDGPQMAYIQTLLLTFLLQWTSLSSYILELNSWHSVLILHTRF